PGRRRRGAGTLGPLRARAMGNTGRGAGRPCPRLPQSRLGAVRGVALEVRAPPAVRRRAARGNGGGRGLWRSARARSCGGGGPGGVGQEKITGEHGYQEYAVVVDGDAGAKLDAAATALERRRRSGSHKR